MPSSPVSEPCAVIRFDAQEVASAAKTRLWKSPYYAVRKVACRFDQGRLTLTGHLSSYYEKQLAQEAVARIDGVAEIVNDIEVAIEPARRFPQTLGV